MKEREKEATVNTAPKSRQLPKWSQNLSVEDQGAVIFRIVQIRIAQLSLNPRWGVPYFRTQHNGWVGAGYPNHILF